MTLPFILLYNLILVPLYLVFRVAGFFNAKIKMTFDGRRGLFDNLHREIERIPADSQRIWIHISSMGEFEQGAPIIEELLSRFPDAWIIVSLFSPSVFRHLDYKRERIVLTYLPFDLYNNATRFIAMVKPAIHLIIRHDIWPNYQWILQRHDIPSVLVDASFSENSHIWAKRFRGIYASIYSTFAAICVVSEMNKVRTKDIVPQHPHIIVCGDTRYDRVYARAMDMAKVEFLKGHIQRSKCIVAGSTWPEDEKVILPGMLSVLKKDVDVSIILAPHEISEIHLKHLEKMFDESGFRTSRLSDFAKEPTPGCRVWLVDSIGLLANLYTFGCIAYVGGGFGAGVHSVLEPAAHGVVVSYGPRHLNSPEAKEMTQTGIGVPVSQPEDFEQLVRAMLDQPSKIASRGADTKNYVMRNIGASKRTADVIQKILYHL